jgi:hypothetical protein
VCITIDDVIEFGCVVLDKQGLFEKQRFQTLLKSSKISKKSIEINHITEQMVKCSTLYWLHFETLFLFVLGCECTFVRGCG